MNPTRVWAVTAFAVVCMIGASSFPAAAANTRLAALDPTSIRDYSNYSDIPADQQGTVSSDCPAGTSVVAVGGFGSVDIGSIANANNTSAVVTSGAFPSEAARAAAVVSCAPNEQLAGTINVTRETHTSDTGIQGHVWTLSVGCPAGMQAFGGGGYFRAANGVPSKFGLISVNTVSRQGRSWSVRARNDVLTDTLVVTARCANASSSTLIVEQQFNADPKTGRAGGYANCPPGYLPISGGATVLSDARPSDTYSFLDFSLPVRGIRFGWYGSGYTMGANGRLQVRVLCGI
jgi:hypothetical protein